MVAIPQDLLPAFRLLFGANDVPPASLDVRSLKRVYRRRALDTHPDRARATGADPAHLTRLFQEVTVAYDVLLEFVARGHGGVSPPPRPAPRPAQPRPRARAASEQGRTRPPASPGAGGKRGGSGAPRREPGAAEPPPTSPGGCAQARDDAGRSRTGAGAGAPSSHVRDGSAASGRATGAATPGATAPSGTASDHFWGGRLPSRSLLLGQFLYYSGRISFRSLIGAIHWQRTQRPHFGQLAVMMGYMPAELVHGLLTLKRFEERIGDAAVRLGVLTGEQRDRLLAMQRAAQRPLGQYFVDTGLIDPDELRRLVTGQFQHNFVRAQRRSR